MHKVGWHLLCWNRRNCLYIFFLLTLTVFPQVPSDKLVKVQSILEKNIQDGAKLITLMNHVSIIDVSHAEGPTQ